MKRLLNTLFVTTQGAYLAKDGETVAVKVEGEVKARFPVLNLSSIVCFGNVTVSPFLLGHCAESGVAVSFCTEHGRFLCRVVGPVHGNVLLRREQYRRADDPAASAALARSVVIGKVANGRAVLARALRDHGEQVPRSEVEAAVLRLGRIGQDVGNGTNLDAIRGLEGDAGQTYFGVFRHLITGQKDDFDFTERTRRPPRDPMNALLSFLYTMLMHDVIGACESVGLDPQVGFLHRDRPGRASLALDLMEELRPVLADRLALSLVNRNQVSLDGFSRDAGGGVTMDDKTRKTVIQGYQERKQDEITHPFTEEKLEIGLLPYAQALLLARHLRGDLDAYPPFLWR